MAYLNEGMNKFDELQSDRVGTKLFLPFQSNLTIAAGKHPITAETTNIIRGDSGCNKKMASNNIPPFE